MFKKGMGIAMCVVGILSLACVAAANDQMQWIPRTPAGGGSPGFLPALLQQAAAVEYGPEATVNRDIDIKRRSELTVENRTQRYFTDYYYLNGQWIPNQQSLTDETVSQNQVAITK